MLNPVLSITNSFQSQWPEALDPKLKSLLCKVTQFLWDYVISIVIFPIGLTRLGCYFIRKSLLDRVLVPGLRSLPKEVIDTYGDQCLKTHRGEKIPLIAPDGVPLDAVFFPGKYQNKVIVYAPGNAGAWQSNENWITNLLESEASVAIVNRRDHLTDPSQLALGVYSLYQYLSKEKKIPLDQMLFMGSSMGAAYTTQAAAWIQEENPNIPIPVISSRSFSDLGLEVRSIIKEYGSEKLGRGCFAKMATCVGAAIAPTLVSLLGLQIHSKKAWDKIKGKKMVIFSETDRVIPMEASLYHAIVKDNRGSVYALRLAPNPGEGQKSHNRMLADNELHMLLRKIQKRLSIYPMFEKPDLAGISVKKMAIAV